MKKRILIIEDEISIAELQRDYLEIDDFEVDIEQTGDLGLKKALAKKFDLIILDLMLPNIDGFEVCKSLRKKIDVPILMVSARKEDIDKIRGLGIGADDYITKPFSPSELVARVKAHLSRYERLKGNNESKREIINIRNIQIDKTSRTVKKDKKELFFTTKEYELLCILCGNPNRVFTREELFDRIWGVEALGEISTVTVHIKKIREKIEADTSNPQYIETIWGVGYRFKV
jgi:DNA-binding response OmpR family regulator